MQGSPAHTLVGSSNFGGRSAHTDLECTLLLSAPSSPAMRNLWEDEYKRLKADAERRFDADLVARERGQMGRRIDSLFVRAATWLLRKNM